tara:strand:- start:9067 stop:10455 length:1389 start_codon:yes stop_codon:yes gene_type:complete
VNKLAIIVPYRNRPEQLEKFNTYLKQYLDNRKYEYFIIVVEQIDNKSFNRGKLLNIGFKEAVRRRCDYVVFHDVDMLPIDVDYSYEDFPIHLATDNLPFENYFGGITLFPVHCFEKINGFSNNYWGWGFEDDDLRYRCLKNGIKLNTLTSYNTIEPTTNLKLNGNNAYIEMLNPLNFKNSFSILLDFIPEKNFFNHKLDQDKFTIFSIPGYDFSISYTSFNRYKLEYFDRNKEYHQIFSNIQNIKNLPTKIYVVFNKEDKTIKFYFNNKLVGEKKISIPFYDYDNEPKAFLGCSKGKENYFKGIFRQFAFYNTNLTEKELNSIYINNKFSLTQDFKNYKSSYALQTFYNTKYVKDYKIIDLSLKNNSGIIYNCEIIENEERLIDTQYIPYRRSGRIKLLKHDSNGFVKDGWKDKNTRWNQLRFNNEVEKGFYEIQKDGLNSLNFKLIESKLKGKVITIKAEL